MLDKLFAQKWLSPLLGILFVAVGATGVCMFFKVGPGVFHKIHELTAIVFVVVGIIHLLRHLKTIYAYLKTPAGLIATVVCVVLVVALWMEGGSGPERRPGGPPQMEGQGQDYDRD